MISGSIISSLAPSNPESTNRAFRCFKFTEVKKKELFAKVRSGQVRVLLGSTAKMGAGTNVQDRLIASHDLDCPWRPGDLEQRAGRIVRQGNMNPKVHIYRYVTEGRLLKLLQRKSPKIKIWAIFSEKTKCR